MANNINDIFKEIRTNTGSYAPPKLEKIDDRFDIYFGDLILISLSFWLIFNTFFSGMSRIINGNTTTDSIGAGNFAGKGIPRYSNTDTTISSPRIKR